MGNGKFPFEIRLREVEHRLFEEAGKYVRSVDQCLLTTCDLSRVYPASCTMAVGTRHKHSRDLKIKQWGKKKDEWMV